MLTEEQILEIREHLERAQNPVFFYDNDADGLCSYLLLRRFIGRGRGVAVRSHPDVDAGYARKAQELSADYVFVLDRPHLGAAFVSEIAALQLPIVWIDHHDVDTERYEDVFVYNPTQGSHKSEEPVSYWSYRINNRREDLWIALMGCIADHHLPDFAETFATHYGDYWRDGITEPFDAYYTTEIGRLAQVLSFGLKDSITHVVYLQNFLIQCRHPSDMLLELESSKPFARKYREIRKKYDLLLDRAKQQAKENLLFFTYGGDLSISSDISNELSFLFPGRVIVVAFTSGPITNLSMRGNNVKQILHDVLKDLDDATGGGHRDAVGARIQSKDLEMFKATVEKNIS